MIAPRFTPLHPAVLRLIGMTVEAGHRASLEVSVCGEMASHPVDVYALVGLGVRQLVMALENGIIALLASWNIAAVGRRDVGEIAIREILEHRGAQRPHAVRQDEPPLVGLDR